VSPGLGRGLEAVLPGVAGDGDVLLQKLPGGANVAHTEHHARLLAFAAEEAVAYLRELFEGGPTLDHQPIERHRQNAVTDN
jgi:hypothetical protein